MSNFLKPFETAKDPVIIGGLKILRYTINIKWFFLKLLVPDVRADSEQVVGLRRGHDLKHSVHELAQR